MHKAVTIAELFDLSDDHISPLFRGRLYPWEVLPQIKEYADKLAKSGMAGYHEIAEGVLAGENVKIHPTATVEGPAIIGRGTELRPGAYLRGSVITGEGCIIGNATELKNCILFHHVHSPHYNYVGDSVLGNGAHMGAGAVCSNLKADGRAVVIHGEVEMATGLRKIGAFLGDGADIGCGCVLNPGCVIGKRTSVYPLTPLRGVYPADAIVKGTGEVVMRRYFEQKGTG